MKLTVGPYRPLEVDVRTGLAADFRLTPAPAGKGVIYQRVTISYKAEGERAPTLYLFTEAWVVNPERTRAPVIDQGGTDAFMVSTRDVAQFGGVVKIVTMAWFEAGARDKAFKKGRRRSLWGTLYGVKGHRRAPPASARPLKRAVTATWRKGGDVRWKIHG